jgi:hypothetical protein
MVGKVERTRLLRDHEIIGLTWGGGEYEVDFKDAVGKYVKKFVRFRFDPRQYGPRKGAASASLSLSAPAPQQDMVLNLMREQAERQNQLIITLLANKPAAPAQAPMGIADVMSAAQVMIGAKQAEADSKLDGFKNAITESVQDAVATATANSGSPVMQIVGKLVEGLAPVITQLVAQQSEKVRNTAPVPPQRTPTGPSGVVINAKSKEAQEVDFYAAMIKAHPLYAKNAPIVMGWAASRRDPAECAEDLVKEIPPDKAPMALGFLQRPDVWGWIQRLEPGAAPHKEWFAELVKVTRDLLSSHDAPTDGTEGDEVEIDDEDSEEADE